MNDIIIEQIIDYITEELGNENRELKRLVDWINFDLKRLYPLQRKKYHESLSEDLKKYKGLINQIKEIREIFQKGKPFTDNQTKDKKKQFTLINMRISTIGFLLSRDKSKEALEQAKISANYIKKYHSDRSYYNFKKRLKEDLAIEI